MSRAVYKYEIPYAGVPYGFDLKLPVGAQVLHVGPQRLGSAVSGFETYVWALVDTDAPHSSRWFFLAGTGDSIPEDAHEHVASWQSQDGYGREYVYHLFECAPPPPGQAAEFSVRRELVGVA